MLTGSGMKILPPDHFTRCTRCCRTWSPQIFCFYLAASATASMFSANASARSLRPVTYHFCQATLWHIIWHMHWAGRPSAHAWRTLSRSLCAVYMIFRWGVISIHLSKPCNTDFLQSVRSVNLAWVWQTAVQVSNARKKRWISIIRNRRWKKVLIEVRQSRLSGLLDSVCSLQDFCWSCRWVNLMCEA